MEKKQYNLGVMDLYPVVCNNTQIENNPYFQIALKNAVDPQKLYTAVRETLELYPLFGCTMKYDKQYYLEAIDEEFILINKAPEERPTEFGDSTKGYLWQICYYENIITFEWCHAVTDGRGGFDFFTAVICSYFGYPAEKPEADADTLGLESIYNKSQQGIPQKKQPSGFNSKDLPYIKRDYKTECHILRAPMKQVLTVSKKNDASPASVLPPLFSMALRRSISPEAKNRNVTCNMPIDCRGIMKKASMHNFIVSKVITYTDKFDGLDFGLVSTIYRALIDVAVQPENIVKEATEKVDLLRVITGIRPRFMQKTTAKIIADALKHTDSNFTFTYLGRLSFPEEIMQQTEDFFFRSWTDFGECNIAAVDVAGTLVLNICENYESKNIIPDFIDICKEHDIHFQETQVIDFQQANLRLKGI